MKKILALVLALTLLLSLAACGSTDNTNDHTEPTDSTTDTTQQTPDEDSDRESEPDSTTEPDAEPEETTAYEITDCRAKTWTDSIGSAWLQTIVEITNTGSTNLYLSSGACDIEDESGGLVTSQTMVSAFPDVLAPGEKGYLYEETILDEPVDGALTVLPREDVEEATVDLIRLAVTETEISDDAFGGVKMKGRVENTSDEEQSLVYITAFLYDADGACIGQLFTILTDSIAAGDKIGFEMSSITLPDDVTAAAVADYVVYAYPMQYQF